MKKILVMAFASIAMLTVNASAAPINGTFSMGGGTISAVSCANPLVGLAVGDNCVNFTVNPIAVTLTGDNDFSAAAVLSQVTAAPLSLNSPSGGTVFNVSTLANVPLFSFTQTGNVGPSLVLGNNAGGFAINLVGIYKKTGFDDTEGILNFTFQPPISASGGGTYTFSASGTTVPEPGTYAMLGTALLGLGLLRRRKA
jgi:hypothetical protein